MTDIPIIFSAPMIRALLDGRKTMTRRLAWSKREPTMSNRGTRASRWDGKSPWQRVKPGDRLWVRENFYVEGGHEGNNFGYAADIPDNEGPPKLVPSIHMPRHLSRLTLVVTAVKIERLQDISRKDAIAEGVEQIGSCQVNVWRCYLPGSDETNGWTCPRESFRTLWESLHGLDAWKDNPEVVALTFTVHKANIDALQAALPPSNPTVTHEGR